MPSHPWHRLIHCDPIIWEHQTHIHVTIFPQLLCENMIFRIPKEWRKTSNSERDHLAGSEINNQSRVTHMSSAELASHTHSHRYAFRLCIVGSSLSHSEWCFYGIFWQTSAFICKSVSVHERNEKRKILNRISLREQSWAEPSGAMRTSSITWNNRPAEKWRLVFFFFFLLASSSFG